MAHEFSSVDSRPHFSLARILRAPVLVAPRLDADGLRADLVGHGGYAYRVDRLTRLIDWMTASFVTNQQATGEFLDAGQVREVSQG